MRNALAYIDEQDLSGNRNLTANEVFDKVNASKNIRDAYGKGIEKQVQYINSLPPTLNAATKSIDRYNASQREMGESTVKNTTLFQDFKSGISSVGSTLLSIGATVGTNLLVSAAIQGVATIADNVSHAQENAIESGNEVIQNYKDINEQMAQSSSWIETNGEKYTTLSKGVSSLGTNLGLTNEEYAEYQELASQIATQFPELVSGYDSLGKPIIKAATDVDTLKATLKTQKVNQYTESVKNAKDVIGKLNAEVNQDKNWFWEEAGTDQQLQSLEKFQSAYEDAFKNKNGNKFLDLSQWLDDGNFVDALDNAGVSVKDFGKLINELNDSQGKLKANSDTNDFLNTIIGSQEDLRNQRENSADELKSYIPAFFQEQRDYQNLLDDAPNIESELTSLINSFSYEDLDKNGFTGDKAISKLKSWSQSAVKELQNKDIQDALNDVFTINDDSSKQSFDSWQKEADAALNKASEKSKSFSREQMRQASGIADQWQNLHDIQTKVAERWNDVTGIKSRDLSIADLETLGTMLSDTQYDGQSFEQMVAQIQNVQDTSRLTLENMQKVVTDTTTAYSSLSTAMSESMSNTGMTADSITAVKTALSSLVSENDAFKDASLDGIFRDTAEGVDLNTDAMKQLIKKQHDMKVDDFTKSIQLQNEAWKEQQKIIDENKSEDAVNAARDKQKEITSDINAIQQAQSQYYAQYKQMENMFSDYSKWMQSASQETAGTPYNNIVSGLEQAYKDFQNDLVGTDSFKNFAAMISPTGATDPADFEENYAKAKRYLQEGDDGVKNFLNDLKSHDLATFNQETGEWVVKAHSAAEAAKALATGTDVASAAFGKLEDYGFHDNTVDDVQDGILKIGEAYTNLADAKSKLKEMEANPENYSETRIQAQRDEVEAYTKDIGDLTDNMQYYIEHQVEEYQQQKDFAENAVKEMAKYQQEIQANPNKYGGVENANQLSNYLTEQMQGYGEAYGIDAASIQAKAIADAKAYRDALKNASIDNPATPDFGDNEESAKSYASALEKIKGASDEQNQSLDETVKTLSKFNSEQIKGINLSDGAYDSEELKSAEQALDTIAQTFGLTNDEAAQLGVLLESIGKIKPDTSYFDATNDELTQAQEKLNELTGTDYKFDFDTSDLDTIQQQIEQAKKQLEQFKKDGQVDYSQEGAQEASDIYEASVRQQQNAEYNGHAITQVGSTDTETSQLLSSAREFMQAKNELDVQTQLANEGAENHLEEAQKNAESAYNTFKDLNEASGNKLGLDTSDIQSTESDLLGLTEDDLKVKVGADTSQAQEDISSLQNVSGSTVTLNCDVTNEESFEQTKSTVESMPKDTTATVNMVVNGESDVEKTVSLIKEAPKNQNSELVVNCTVANKEEYDTIMQAQNEANSSGANIKVNATIGEVDTSSADASSTPVEVQGQIKDVEPYSGDTKIDVTATIKSVDPYSGNEKVDVTGHITSVEPYSGEVDVNAKANITGVVGGDNLNVVVNARAHVTGSDGQTSEGTINYKKGNVEKADGTTSEGIINYKKGDVEKADGTVSTGIINYDLGNVATPTGMVATGVINYTLGSVAKPGKAAGTFGQSRAYAQGSLTDLSAYAGGRVSLPKDEKALVNEIGTESIVRDGQWSLIPGGAHLENLKKGDIIFSASQTEDLLKRGATPGHARAYAQGSLSDLSLLLAPAHAGTRGSFYHDTHKTSVSSGSGSSDTPATQQHTGAVQKDTDATEENTSATKDSTEAFDWVKTKLDKFSKAVERISNQITDYISSAFKTVLLKRQVKAVEKQLKANEQGYTVYMNKANSVDISDDYKNKVINGTFSIEEIDTSSDSGKQLAKDVKSFQTYYNSAQDCKDTVQELNNKLLELYETIVNMPTEKAEKKIDRLKTKMESLSSVSDTVSLGGSAIAAMQNQIKVDNPGLGNAQKKLDKAETARNITKKTRAKASRDLKSATADAESTGNTLIKESEKQTKSIGKKLKNAAKSSTNKSTYNAIAQAVREGKPVNLKGLKGSALKYAKSYNSSLKQGNTIASKVKAGKTVKTSGMSNILKSTAQAYNADAKEKASAQKIYDNAKKADEKALNDLTKAQKNKEKLYSGSTKEQQILATTKGKKSYVYQNMLLTQETKNLKEQNKQRQTALKETRDSYMKAKNRYDTADADKTKSQNKLLNNKTVMSKLSDSQKKALKAGKTVSTKGITDPKVLKWIQDYNEKVKKSADLSKKLRIEQEALDKATSEAAQSQAEYAQSIVENAKKKLENIANYYDSFTSQWENRNSMYGVYMDRMQTQGYNLSTKFYEAEIGQQQKIVDNLSQKYIAMKRNFAQAVQDGKIVEGTEEYYEMQNEIDQVAISLEESQNKLVEFQAAIRDLKWEQFDQLQEAIGRITSESDFLIDLMSHKDMYDKDGNMTEQGLATMGLHGVNYNTYMAQADKYKEEMLKISEELANDPNNQKLIDRKNELIDAQQQSILSAEDEKDSIKDLIQDGIDKQLDALDDLIDKYLDCLESEKSLYEYRKKIGEQSEKIASLQKQLSSLQGDNSEENKAKLQKLKEDLKSAQDDMEETQYDKYISDQKKLLDELKQDYKKALDDRMDNVDVLISDAIASINSNSSNISQTLQTESKKVGYTLSGEMQTIWTSQSQALSLYDDKFKTRFTGVTTAIGNVYERQKSMIDAIDKMAEKLVAKADQMLQQPTKTEGVLEEVEQKPDKDNVAEGNPTPDPPKVSDDESIRDAVLVDPDEPDPPKKKPNKTNEPKTGNNKAEVGDKVTYVSGRYYGDSDGGHGSGNYYLGKKVKITRINKGSKYPYAIDAIDGTELGWVKLNQLKGYASGIMRVPNDQLAWTQEQGEEAIVRNDGSILTPLSRDVSVLNADMTKNLWDFMGNPGSFLSDYSDGEKFGVKNVDNSSSVDVGGVTIQCNMPNVQNANDLLHELTTNKDIEKAICAMTIGRAMGGSSLAKYKYKK